MNPYREAATPVPSNDAEIATAARFGRLRRRLVRAAPAAASAAAIWTIGLAWAASVAMPELRPDPSVTPGRAGEEALASIERGILSARERRRFAWSVSIPLLGQEGITIDGMRMSVDYW
jgi:hypothetical protein